VVPDGTEEITELRFYVDDPRALVARARRVYWPVNDGGDVRSRTS
jgi:hypothetical protein